MTMMSLRTLLEKSSDADLLRKMVGFAAQRQMELEAEGLTGAGYREKSPDRLAPRNGYLRPNQESGLLLPLRGDQRQGEGIPRSPPSED